MAGLTTLAIASVASVGLGAYSMSQSAGAAHTAQGMQSTAFGEQQSYEKQLADLIANPSSITSMPGYQFQYQQGLNALMAKGASTGGYNSGGLGAALTQYGQQFATSDLTQQENLLASLSGIQTATSPATYGSNELAANQMSFNQLGSILGGLGYAASRYGGYGAGTPAGGWSSGQTDSAGGIGPGAAPSPWGMAPGPW